jgi:hypothetical protein
MIVLDFCFVFLLVDSMEYAQNISYKTMFLNILQSGVFICVIIFPRTWTRSQMCAYWSNLTYLKLTHKY